MIDTKTAAVKLGVCVQRVSALAAQGRIPGARKFAKVWMFPNNPTVTPGTRGPRPKREEKKA
jgi:hypothetical protein